MIYLCIHLFYIVTRMNYLLTSFYIECFIHFILFILSILLNLSPSFIIHFILIYQPVLIHFFIYLCHFILFLFGSQRHYVYLTVFYFILSILFNHFVCSIRLILFI